VRRAVLVLGMHRSGTSALAGLMVRLGVDSPRTLMPPDDFNPLGYWESEAVVAFHDRVLRALGTSWDAWTAVESQQTSRFEDELTRIITAEFGSAPIFVVKDPRMCRLVPLWLSTLETSGIAPGIILVVRDPVEVSRSLAARDRMSSTFALLLWLRHMLDAEYATRALPRAIVSYHGLMTDWRAEIRQISTGLGITWPCSPETAGEAAARFLSSDLRHHASGAGALEAPAPLDRRTVEACDALERLRRGDAASTAHALSTLDDVRRWLDEAARIFGVPDEAVRSDLNLRLEHATSHAADLDVQAGHARQEMIRLQAEHDALVRRHEDLQRANQVLADGLDAARHEVAALRASRSWRVTAPLRALYRLAQKTARRS
jgi:hypothetical protein